MGGRWGAQSFPLIQKPADNDNQLEFLKFNGIFHYMTPNNTKMNWCYTVQKVKIYLTDTGSLFS